jgi:hypothetical protein
MITADMMIDMARDIIAMATAYMAALTGVLIDMSPKASKSPHG